MNNIIYGKKEIKHLKSVDPKLENVIDEFGYLKREIIADLFSALVQSIISQQISTKAASTISNRLLNIVGELTPNNVIKLSDEALQSCGLSFKKVNYIKGISNAFINNEISHNDLNSLSDEEIITELTKLKGIGPWTAKMIMIHTLLRPDVLTFDDLGLREGMRILHGLTVITKEHFNHYQKLYSPYGSVAAIYLWEVYDRYKKNDFY